MSLRTYLRLISGSKPCLSVPSGNESKIRPQTHRRVALPVARLHADNSTASHEKTPRLGRFVFMVGDEGFARVRCADPLACAPLRGARPQTRHWRVCPSRVQIPGMAPGMKKRPGWGVSCSWWAMRDLNPRPTACKCPKTSSGAISRCPATGETLSRYPVLSRDFWRMSRNMSRTFRVATRRKAGYSLHGIACAPVCEPHPTRAGVEG